MLEAEILLLLLLVHGAPVLATWLMGGLGAFPIDCHRRLADGQPLFGPTKTWRGLIVAVLSASLLCFIVQLPIWVGILIAIFGMAGDLLSSCIKRRRGLASSSKAPGLDQLPEALLPLLLCYLLDLISLLSVFGLTLAFWVIEVWLSPLLFRIRIRRRPY